MSVHPVESNAFDLEMGHPLMSVKLRWESYKIEVRSTVFIKGLANWLS